MKKDQTNKKQNIGNIVLLIALSAVILFFSIGFIFNSDKSFSEEENRLLQTFPRFTLEKLFSGTYTEQLHDFYSDQISLRNILIGLRASSELAMGKNENNSVIFAKDGYLIDKHVYTEESYSILSSNTKRIDELCSSLSLSGISCNAVMLPRKIDVAKNMLPPYYSTERADAAWSFVSDGFITMTDALKKVHESGDQVFFKTDHHWTATGAYHAYRELGAILGYTPLPLDSFELYSTSEDFFGTTYSSSGFIFASPDTLTLPKNDERFVTEIVDTGASFNGFYDLSYLETKDKYSVYIGGNNAHVSVKLTNGEARDTLLLVKDSFSHALVPYLAEHFDLEIIDMRYYTDSLTQFIEDNGIENVLFIYGLDTLASANIYIR